jgi:hypothetical protein
MAKRLKRLSKADVSKIEDAVDALFDKAKVRFLGPNSVAKRMYVGYTHDLSLRGLYEAAASEEKGIPDREHLDQLLRTAANYIESLRHKAKANVVAAVQGWLANAQTKTDVDTVLGGQLADLWADISSQMRRIIDTESQNVRNVGVLEGVVRANAAAGIEDPVVYFVVVRDSHLCDECKRLHLLGDGVTPRVWYMSEIGHNYHERGDAHPKVGGLHPHCRCSLTTLMPGFGFNGSGMVVWKSQGHNELERQRHS